MHHSWETSTCYCENRSTIFSSVCCCLFSVLPELICSCHRWPVQMGKKWNVQAWVMSSQITFFCNFSEQNTITFCVLQNITLLNNNIFQSTGTTFNSVTHWMVCFHWMVVPLTLNISLFLFSVLKKGELLFQPGREKEETWGNFLKIKKNKPSPGLMRGENEKDTKDSRQWTTAVSQPVSPPNKATYLQPRPISCEPSDKEKHKR